MLVEIGHNLAFVIAFVGIAWACAWAFVSALRCV